MDHKNPSNPSPQELLERELAKTSEIVAIEKSDLLKIRDAILPSMRIIDGRELRIGDDVRADLKAREDFIVELLVDLLAQAMNFPLHRLGWRIAVREVSEDVYQIDSNLSDLVRISTTQLHDVLKSPFFEITGMNLQLRRMRAVNAAAGLTEAQTHVIEKRVDFMARVHVESDTRRRFAKILEVADIPTMAVGSKFDPDELITMRDTDVARSFRDWIQQSQLLDDRDIRDLIGGWGRRLGEVLKTKNAKGIRFLVPTGAGTVLGLAGVVASVLDYFIDTFLPEMGPIGFVIGDYQRYVEKLGKRL